MTAHPSVDESAIDDATHGFVVAALWADGIPVDMTDSGETGGLEHLIPSQAVVAWARERVKRFMLDNADDVVAHLQAFPDPDGGEPAEYLGHTFYLNASGHGVSFTDRAWHDDDPMTEVCKRLSVAARAFSEIEHVGIFDQGDGTAGF